MFRYKSTKNTLIIAVMVILICLVATVGVTYALFTSGDDGKIGINTTSGQLKVDIVGEDDNSLVGQVLDFMTTDTREKIYFEPGATYYTGGFSVKNVGSIPIKFRVYISEDESADMEALEKAFDFWITKDPKNPDAADKITSFTGDTLAVGQKSDTYYLVIRMKEDAGNEFQNKTYTGIGITVYAVQSNVDM